MEATIPLGQLEHQIKHELVHNLADMLFEQSDMHWTTDCGFTHRTIEIAILPPSHYRRIRRIAKELFAASNDPLVRELVQLLEFPETIKS
jgi:hypothetical protein